MTTIGRLAALSPREAWQHEAYDFTPWLADNLDQLGEVLGLSLEPEGVEVSVGAFSADILARDALGRLVLIENQLAPTNHMHLGQIMTYLSGLDAKIVIWIATDFRDPHLSALHWLNENTPPEYAFFAVRLRVVKIGDSLPAPIFDVLTRPNEWDRQMHGLVASTTGESSSYAEERREFWQFYLDRHPGDAELGAVVTGTTSNWLQPTRDIGMVVSIYRARTGVGVFLRGPRGTSAQSVQERLMPHAEEFSKLVGSCNHLGEDNDHPSDDLRIDMLDRANWARAADWMHERAHAFLQAAVTVLADDTANG